MGGITRQPLLWALVSAGMATVGGSEGRKAALRGTGCYLVGAAVGNLPKPVFGRPQPRHRRARKPQVIRGSFPSGHACAEVAFVFGAAQEMPKSFLPFATMAMLGHLSLIRRGKHYLSDTLVGGVMGLAIAAYAARRWPTALTRRMGLFSAHPAVRQAPAVPATLRSAEAAPTSAQLRPGQRYGLSP